MADAMNLNFLTARSRCRMHAIGNTNRRANQHLAAHQQDKEFLAHIVQEYFPLDVESSLIAIVFCSFDLGRTASKSKSSLASPERLCRATLGDLLGHSRHHSNRSFRERRRVAVMRHQNDGPSFPMEFREVVHDVQSRLRIEVPGRLVSENVRRNSARCSIDRS